MDPKITQLQELLNLAKTVVVIVKDQPSVDQLAVATTLAQGLRQLGKAVNFLSPSAIVTTPVTEHLTGLDELENKMGNQNLVVSFEYDEVSVDKVSYHIGEESGKFFLTVKPQKGHPPLDSSKVEFAYTGMDADLAFLVGIHDLESLENLYFGHESFYADVPMVTIHTFEPEIGLIKFDYSGHICLAEGLVDFLLNLQVPLSGEMASNLLLSIEERTQGLTSMNTTADTFERVAQLMRAGGRRYKLFNVDKSAVKTDASSSPAEEAVKKNGDENEVFMKSNHMSPAEADSEIAPKASNKKIKQFTIEKSGSLDHQPSGLRS